MPDIGIILRVIGTVKSKTMKLAGVDLGDGTAAAKVSVENSAENPANIQKPTHQHKIIDNETITGTDTATTYDLDFSKYDKFAILIKLGTLTGTASVAIAVNPLDSNGNVLTDSDYSTVTYSTAVAVANAIEGTLKAHKTLRITITPSGTGNFAGSTVEIQAK